MTTTYMAVGLIVWGLVVLALEIVVGATRLLGSTLAALRSGR